MANDEIDAIQVPPVDFEVKATVHSMGPLKAPPFILSRSLGGGEGVINGIRGTQKVVPLSGIYESLTDQVDP